MLDVYNVYCCGNEFAIKSDQEPNNCPFCGRGDAIEFSHEVERSEDIGF